MTLARLWVFRVALACGLALVAWASLEPVDQVPLATSLSDKLLHTGGYAALGLCAALAQRRPRIILSIVLVSAFGLLLEFLQGRTGYRSFDWLDFWADAAGAAIGVGLGALLLEILRPRDAQT